MTTAPLRLRPAHVAAGAAIALVAVLVRLTSWAEVFTARGVRFVADGDPYYHVRRARMILDAGAIVWRDRWLDYPAGADIPWPPLFDLLLAGATWLVGFGHPSPQLAASVAAIAPVVVGVITIAVASFLAREIFGTAVAVFTAILLALSQPLVEYSVLGRPDQHVLEVLLFCAVNLAFVRGLRDERLRPGLVLLVGALLAASFWNWLGSALTLLLFGAACVVAGVVTAPELPEWGRPARLLAASSAVAAALLAISIGFAGPPGALRHLRLGGLSAFQVALPAVTAVLCAVLIVPRARSRAVRAGALVAMPIAVAALLLAIPAFRDPVLRGLAAAGQTNEWYGSISEFMPVLFSGLRPFGDELRASAQLFGLTPFLAALGMGIAVARLPAEPERAPAILLAVTLGLLLTIAALRMTRFMSYASIPLAMFGGLGVVAVRDVVERRWPRTGTVMATATVLLAILPTGSALSGGARDMSAGGLERMLLRVRESPERGDRRAVLSPWTFGHHVLYLAERPVLASPFGTEGGASAMGDLTAFYTAADPAEAEALLARRGAQYVLLKNPREDVALLVGHGGRGGLTGVRTGRHVALDALPSLVVTRLYDAAGSGTDDPARPALEAFRLVDEEDPDAVPLRLFEVVPGAIVTVRGGTPGGRVTVTVTLLAPFGGEGGWRTARTLDANGEARLRLPYATGPNGRIVARAYALSDGVRSAQLTLAEEDVVRGAALSVDLRRPASRDVRSVVTP